MAAEPDRGDATFVSTGALPARSWVRDLVDEAHRRYRADRQGRVSQVYPALARVPPELFGVCVVGVDGAVYCTGDADYEFAIMSVSKPFALVCELIGGPGVRDMVGVNGTGFPVQLAGRDRASIARLLQSYDRLYCEPSEAVDLYTRQCSLKVTAHDLAVMGATLADGGVNPVTSERVIDPAICHRTLAVMLTAGLYESSGEWLYDVGMPAKSGIGGGIVTFSPGKGGMATFAPPLDHAGNSVKGQLVARFLSAALGMDLLISTRHEAPSITRGRRT